MRKILFPAGSGHIHAAVTCINSVMIIGHGKQGCRGIGLQTWGFYKFK